MTLRFGIVGCGCAAADVCAAIGLVAGADIAAVVDRSEDRARAFGDAYCATVHESFDGLVADPGVDVVYVALPHHLLASFGKRALVAGKHALVEKPMALESEVARSLGRAAIARNRVVAPMFELRAVPAFGAARRMVLGGAIGDVTAVRIRTLIDKPMHYWSAGPSGRTPSVWRARRAEAGGGVVLMNSIHQLDLVRYVTGLEVASVVAETATAHVDVEVEDSAAAVLRYANGAIGIVVAGAHSPGARQEERIEIEGTEGRLDLPDPSNAASGLRVFLRRPWERVAHGDWATVEVPAADPYVDYLSAFIAAVRGQCATLASADDAAAAVAIVSAVYESAATGRRVAVGQ